MMANEDEELQGNITIWRARGN